ncbi:hypothetical protein F5878DRAFT_729561 [Lentinula raphanica]|uniref:Uncharacterized protein n=1 Tax=Lentinula raphanica TaxID=153919 RepID=A0AA38NWA6_9AGAR|nr:hypothetical protein F5878DRAFT_729561 [Lentinula raphanica]
MASTSSSSSSPANQQQTQSRGPAFSKWPTVKIFMPPQGRFSPKRDEWCLTYCTQSITGRIHAVQPSCTTLCIRKVFEHEVKNVTGFKRHDMSVMGEDDDGDTDATRTDGSDGKKVVRKKAIYSLPPEGQPDHVPKVLGGARTAPDPSASPSTSTTSESESLSSLPATVPTPIIKTRSWSPGYYLFTSTTIYGTFEHLASMSRDLPRQVSRQKKVESIKKEWIEYQEWVEKIQKGELQETVGREGSSREGSPGIDANEGQSGSQLGKVDEKVERRRPPPQPMPDYLASTLLVPLPPASLTHLTSQLTSQFISPMSKFLKPTGRALELFGNDLQGGIYQQFASRVYSKAQTDEPAKLARRSWERLLEAWKGDGGDKGDGKDGGIKG